ncbi:MAG TPA: DUF6351 family protein [Bryobacteraceae bacterium]|nr:DUF6351 family protein [Bryobacteraceae bacterium]
MQRSRWSAGHTSEVVSFCGLLAAMLAAAAVGRAGEPAIGVTSLSNRPDRISGGDALVRVDLPAAVMAGQAIIRLNGREVTSVFQPDPSGRSLTGLVTGLEPGRNRLDVTTDVTAGDKGPSGQLILTNHPSRGPVFSGPQEQPFVCSTDAFQLPDGSTLGAPLDKDCSSRTVVHYVYKPASVVPGAVRGKAAFKPLPNPGEPPPDVAWTVTSSGQKAPFIVRVETGTINRAIYQTAILHDPNGEPAPGPLSPPKSWNRRLIYTFGGGCSGGWFKQGVSIGIGGILDEVTLGKGYAQASATLNVFGNNCSDLIAAETMMMVKERFIEAYGPPAFTMGEGGSGGSYQQLQISDNYPGLLDGIMPSATFPDVLATIQMLTDFQLLQNYFTRRPDALTEEQKRAVAGVAELKSVAAGAVQARRIHPAVFCPAELPTALRYDAAANPGGARCDVFDHTVNVYGRDPGSGFARRPVDNTGVQYGLAALRSGTINATQFLELNESIGGYDQDGNLVPTRAAADPLALRAAYQTGRVTNGGGGLSRLPILDLRGYRDQSPNGDIHLKYHSFSLRQRLRRANGTASNHVLLVSGSNSLVQYGIDKMDEWLTRLGKDQSSDPVLEKIERARPAELVDSCYRANGERIVEEQVFGAGQCGAIYPDFPSPRMAAGGPASNDVLKCQLKPLDWADYPAGLTEEEKGRLAKIFPAGVCDWSRPGVEQQPLAGAWLSF